jgi:tetratricopeptide (TPR) repeat protein
LFPDYYESYYFKGKLLFKQKFYSEAIQVLNQAELFNSSKKEIKYLIAECYRSLGQRSKALQYYEPNITTVSLKNVKHAIEYGSLLI